jgi:L-seryl-tRNA(Ser) seleniumtransferase
MHYLKDEATLKIPIWQMISLPAAEIDRRVKMWANSVGEGIKIIEGESVIGGGSLPGATLPTRLISIGNPKKPAQAQKLARKLRLQTVPIVGRINENVLLLDPRTVLPKDDEFVVQSLRQALSDLK